MARNGVYESCLSWLFPTTVADCHRQREELRPRERRGSHRMTRHLPVGHHIFHPTMKSRQCKSKAKFFHAGMKKIILCSLPESLLDTHNVVNHNLSPALSLPVVTKPYQNLPLWCYFCHPVTNSQVSNHDDCEKPNQLITSILGWKLPQKYHFTVQILNFRA